MRCALSNTHGFTLVETLIALFIVTAALAGMAQLSALTARANAQARSITMATVLAGQKMEQLRSTSAHLQPATADALRRNVDGLCDFLDAHGRPLGHGTVAPVGSAYVRRWSLGLISTGSGSALVLQVVVQPEGRGAIGLGTGQDEVRRSGGGACGVHQGARDRLTVAPRVSSAGFSLVEVLMATSLFLVVLAGVFGVLHPARGAFAVEPERADIEQRLRAAADALVRDLAGTGAGPSQGEHPGPLHDALPPVLPYRQGRRSPDPPGRYRTDAVTLLRVAGSAAQTTIAQTLVAQSGAVQIQPGPGCPPGDPACGFKRGMDVVVFDGTGSYDTFTVSSVQDASLGLQHNLRDVPTIYAPSVTRIAEVVSRTYYLKADQASDTYQLMQYDGAGGADIPVVDHVVGLSFEFLGDSRPPDLLKPLSDPAGPWTTYGPAPEASQGNCLFEANETPWPTPRLSVLGAGEPLVLLTAAELTDGPWCPDARNPHRYDADLFRIRSIVVRLRVEAAPASLRGPAGLLFMRGGSSRDGRALAPDREIRLEVAPRNLAARR